MKYASGKSSGNLPGPSGTAAKQEKRKQASGKASGKLPASFRDLPERLQSDILSFGPTYAEQLTSNHYGTYIKFRDKGVYGGRHIYIYIYIYIYNV